MKYDHETRQLYEVKELPIVTLSESLANNRCLQLGLFFSNAERAMHLLNWLMSTNDIEEISKIKKQAAEMHVEMHNETARIGKEERGLEL